MPASGKLEQLCVEAWPLAQMWFFAQRAKALPRDDDLAFCYDVLNKVSRSFAVVIQQLPACLRDSVCLFYLVLRALDTVEDDMAVPIEKKLPVLRSFHEKIFLRQWKMNCGYKEYARLMAEYPKVTAAFLSLPGPHQQVIADICRRMGEGMAEFIERDVTSVEDYNLYCHYVAGLVGIGLSKLFAASSLEGQEFASMEDLSNSMGLFLQKTNIIRDYLEDIMEEPAPRMFWPKEIWGQYASNLGDFKERNQQSEAVQALNHMVTDALRHALDSLSYLAKLRNRDIFRFCAIPQVMAIATLAAIYNNPNVFTGVVKVRRGVVARYMIGLNGQPDLLRAFAQFSKAIISKCHTEAVNDPNAAIALARAEAVHRRCSSTLQNMGQPIIAPVRSARLLVRMLILLATVAALYTYAMPGSGIGRIGFALTTAPILLVTMLFIYSSSQTV